MANDRVRDIASKYGGNFAGSGVSPLPSLNTVNRGIYFDPQSKQNFQVGEDGKFKLIVPPQQRQNLLQKAGAVIDQTFGFHPDRPSLLESAVTGAGKFVYHSAIDIGRAALGVGQAFVDARIQPMQLAAARDFQEQLDKRQEELQRAYGAGKLSLSDYQAATDKLTEARMKINNEMVKPTFTGPTPQERVMDIAETVVNVLSLGKYKPIEAVVKGTAKGVTRQGLDKSLFTIGKNLEDAMKVIPAFRELVTRNAALFAGQSAKQLAGETTAQFLTRNSKQIAIGLLIKRPIVYQSNIGLAHDLYNDMLTGDYNQAVKDAAWIGAQAIGGGPLGWFFRNTKSFAGKLRQLANGKGSFIDELSKRIGTGSPAQIARYLQTLKEKAPKEYEKAEKAFRIAQEVNLRATNDNVQQAVTAVLTHYDQHGIDLANLHPHQLVEDLHKWAAADKIAQKMGPNYVAVRWDKVAKDALVAKVLEAGDDLNAMAKAVADMAAQPGVGWGNNRILMTRITSIIRKAESAEAAAKAIRAIKTTPTMSKNIPKSMAKRLSKMGYTLAEPHSGRKTPSVKYEDTRKLVSAVSNGADDLFDETVAPQPQLAALAGLLRKIGLSPESNTNVAYDKLSAALVSNINDLNAAEQLGLKGDDAPKGAKLILSRLSEYIDKQRPNPYLNVLTGGRNTQSALQDIRQMNANEIMEALPGLSKDAARSLQKAILKSYTDVPLEFRGLGMKAFDYAYRAPGAKAYFRVQSALRYTYNPFFRAQEVIETKVLSHMKANNLVWMKPRAELDRVSQMLDDSKIFTSGYTGESTQDLTIGRIHANLVKTQKRDLAGLAMDIAEKRGITIEKMLQDHPDELADALRVIVQYPSKGILNSSLARTINVAFFPMRYNAKVAMLAAEQVAKLPPTVQVAFIHSMFKMQSWFKSEEGIQWQSENADAIQVFKYFTPIGTIQSVLTLLTPGRPDSIGELGQLGGLPFGVISQMLDAQGIISLNTPFVDQTTGEVAPKYIPETAKAKAAVAMQSLINSMFTYPGRVVGLPGKGEKIREGVDMFLKTGGDEYLPQVRTQDLTPLQRKWIDVLSNPNVSQDQIDQLYVTPAPGEFQWYTLPPMHLPQPVKVLSKTEVAQMKAAQSGGGSGGKKKALPVPEQGEQLQLP